ncbi:MAG: glycosyltransferase family 4 protein [Gemmatimonadaceae bacterium]
MITSALRTVAHYSDSEAFGGTERALLQLVADLDREKWRSVLFHAAVPGAEQVALEARALGAIVHPVARVTRPMEGVSSLPSLAMSLRRARVAVFHAHQTWSLSCRYGIVAASIARVPAIVASMQLFIEMPPLAGIDLQYAFLSRCLDRHIAVSRSVAARLRGRFHAPDAKMRVIPNAITLRLPVPPDQRLRAELAGDDSTPLVLTVARLDAQKGVGFLLDAAAALPEAAFVIAGDGPERAALEARAEALGLDDRVRFLGHRRDVPSLLAVADVFVLPSLYEGLPLSVMEAMAANVPVVATAIGGTDEIVRDGETGWLVAPGDGRALAAGIRAVLVDRERAVRIADAALDYVTREHSSAAMAAEVGRLYEELLRR